MGAAVAGRLLSVGHDVTVWNRTRGKTEVLTLAGANLAATPAELATAAGAMKTIPLAVAGAFHTPIMQPAVEKLSAVLKLLV